MVLIIRVFVFLTVFLPGLICAEDSLTVKQAVEIALADWPVCDSRLVPG